MLILSFQSSSGVSSKVLDDYCWVHSTFHIRTEYQVQERGSLPLIPPPHSSSSLHSISPSLVAKRTVFLSQEHLFTAYVANAEKKPHNMCSPKQDRSSYNQSSLVLVSDLSNQKLKSKQGDGDTVYATLISLNVFNCNIKYSYKHWQLLMLGNRGMHCGQ